MEKITRKKRIEYDKLGQRKTLSNSQCHQCRNMIPLSNEIICKGKGSEGNRKEKNSKICKKRFCSDCLEKFYPESLTEKLESKILGLMMISRFS
jgi:hypothetical protein